MENYKLKLICYEYQKPPKGTFRFKSNGFSQDVRSWWMEALSKVHFSVPLFIYIPVIVACFLKAQGSYFSISMLFISGLFVWTFVEYALHRFLFHWTPPGKWGKRLHFIWHGVHHDYPNDRLRLILPPSVSIPLSSLFFDLYYMLLGTPSVYSFFSGFILGYFSYDMMHFAMNHLHWNNAFWLKIKKHHMFHHYQEHDKGFGVSNPLWDYIFSTTFNGKTDQNPWFYILFDFFVDQNSIFTVSNPIRKELESNMLVICHIIADFYAFCF